MTIFSSVVSVEMQKKKKKDVNDSTPFMTALAVL